MISHHEKLEEARAELRKKEEVEKRYKETEAEGAAEGAPAADPTTAELDDEDKIIDEQDASELALRLL